MNIFQGAQITLAMMISGCGLVDPCAKTRGKSLDKSQIEKLCKESGPYASWAYLGPCTPGAGVVRRRHLNNFGGYRNEFYMVENSVLSDYLNTKILNEGSANEPCFFWPQLRRVQLR